MADIERGFGGDSLIAREWATRAMRAPRDAQWLCSACARTHNEWSPTCSACGGFDTLCWLSGSRGAVETLTPIEAAKAYEEATESATALYRDAVKAEDVRPPVRSAAPEPPREAVRDVSPEPEPRIVFAPDDPGPDADDYALTGDDRRRSGTW
jgi:HemY protein